MQASVYFVVGSLLTGCGSSTEEPAEAPVAVRAIVVQQGPVAEGRRYLAEVVPKRTVQVLAQVPGTVSEQSVWVWWIRLAHRSRELPQ